MKEKIYTIPVMEVFQMDCECPFCELETRLEDEMVSDMLGASLMDPDIREKTNKNGFCRKHFEMLYNKEENRLGFGLIIDTHMQEQNKKFKNVAEPGKIKESFKGFLGKAKSGDVKGTINKVIEFINEYESKCHICDKLNYTMDRYIDIMFYLYFSESDFRQLFHTKKGFCLPHLKQLLEYAKKLEASKASAIVNVILTMQIDNLQRIQEEVDWFTKKFDYRYENEPWGNSRDSIPRSIRKLTGPCRFK